MSDFAPLPMSAADVTFNSDLAAYADVLRLRHRKTLRSSGPLVFIAIEDTYRRQCGLTAIPPPPPQSWWRRLWHRFKALAKN